MKLNLMKTYKVIDISLRYYRYTCISKKLVPVNCYNYIIIYTFENFKFVVRSADELQNLRCLHVIIMIGLLIS